MEFLIGIPKLSSFNFFASFTLYFNDRLSIVIYMLSRYMPISFSLTGSRVYKSRISYFLGKKEESNRKKSLTPLGARLINSPAAASAGESITDSKDSYPLGYFYHAGHSLDIVHAFLL